MNGVVELKMTEMMLENSYLGFGQHQEMANLSTKIAEYEEAANIVATGKGKEKREAKDVVEDINDSLNMCQEELNNILNEIQKNL